MCEGDEIDVGDGWTDPLPTRINAGVSLRLEGPATLIGDTEVPVVSVVQNVDVTNWRNAGTTWGLGIEAAFLEIVFVRMGNFQEDNERLDEFTWGLGFGVPVGPVRAHLDYASRPPTWYWYPVADADQYGLSIVWSLP